VFSGVLQAVGRRVHFDYVRQQTIQVAHVPGVPALSGPRSATTSSSPSGRKSPDPEASDNRIAVTAARAALATGPSCRARNRSHASGLKWERLCRPPSPGPCPASGAEASVPVRAITEVKDHLGGGATS
jgi:hypothetical protein